MSTTLPTDLPGTALEPRSYGDRVTTGTVQDLPNPLARAYAMAMAIGVVVDWLPPVDDDFGIAGLFTLLPDGRGVRDTLLMNPSLDEDATAELVLFTVALVMMNRAAGLPLEPFVHESSDSTPDDMRAYVAIKRERVARQEGGPNAFFAELARACDLEDNRPFCMTPVDDEEDAA